jgi:hypothetical protein
LTEQLRSEKRSTELCAKHVQRTDGDGAIGSGGAFNRMRRFRFGYWGSGGEMWAGLGLERQEAIRESRLMAQLSNFQILHEATAVELSYRCFVLAEDCAVGFNTK